MNKTVLSGIVFVSALILGCSGLTQQQVNTITKGLLSESQLACVMSSTLTDSQALATVCGIDQALVPVLQQLIGVREGAKRAGVQYKPVGVTK